MMITIDGTRTEIQQFQDGPVLVLVAAEPAQRVHAYKLADVRICRCPYSSAYRLLADLVEMDDRGAT
ncbi:hypothetical protein ACFFMN_09290 [Planobispora siamensis]|uniref:Uncharacterized protein n=1 Tax=Planobispora siamensis TaxID=936338 RepID=A0A8J3SBQ0_9ACTN|nr:hypothetical protein [Planobispora siamensis]GIH91178.1 hypothetical protein Psi01_18080 [Planobispora siamensis]